MVYKLRAIPRGGNMEVYEGSTLHQLVDREEELRSAGEYIFHYEIDGAPLTDSERLEQLLRKENDKFSSLEFPGRQFHWRRTPQQQASFFVCRSGDDSEVLATVGRAVGQLHDTWMWRIQSGRLLQAQIASEGETNAGREQAAADAEFAIQEAERQLR